MCGIAGFIGLPDAPRAVKAALRTLEYRGYDSCGAAWVTGGKLKTAKAVGVVEGLDVPATRATVAIGHTRWATHGGVTPANAHPHVDCTGTIAVVHNGILSNHEELRAQLEAAGHTFRSQTDSEALAHLWEGAKGNGLQKLRQLLAVLEGTFSVAVLEATGNIWVAKRRNPLWVARGRGYVALASDPIALRPHATHAHPLEDGDHGRLGRDGIQIYDANGQAAKRPAVALEGLDDRGDKAGYEHFMLKEIHETPTVVNRLMAAHAIPSGDDLGLGITRRQWADVRRILFLGAGTSHHAGLLGAEYMRRRARVGAEARPSPEYKDDPDIPDPGTLVVALSQSGETLDTLQALHRLSSHPNPLVALTNHPTSSIARMADHCLPLQAGLEVSVASTKTFLSQAYLLYVLALAKGKVDGVLSDAELRHGLASTHALTRAIQRTLKRTPEAQAMARDLARQENAFLLAKGLNLPAAMEGALKLKEIAYMHAEAYPAGELKHGPFALLTAHTPVIFLLAPGPGESQLRSSLQEVQARGSPTYVLAIEGCAPVRATQVLTLPAIDLDLQPFVFASALHLLSYWVAKARGLPIDKPRNLAKSVTVE